MVTAKESRLIVVSTNALHRLMLPDDGTFPLSIYFYQVGSQPYAFRPEDFALVIEPHLLSTQELQELPKGQAWWFLSSLVEIPQEVSSITPHVYAHAIQSLETKRRVFLTAGAQPFLVIAPDEPSSEWLANMGIENLLSQPAVSDKLFNCRKSSSSSILMLGSSSRYVDLFLKVVTAEIEVLTELPNEIAAARHHLERFSIGVNVGESFQKNFSFGAAVHLVAGHALISEALQPLHGLEPGIDYFEFSSPEELLHILNYVQERPRTLELMRSRGYAKASYFRASLVWPKLLSRLEKLLQA